MKFFGSALLLLTLSLNAHALQCKVDTCYANGKPYCCGIGSNQQPAPKEEIRTCTEDEEAQCNKMGFHSIRMPEQICYDIFGCEFSSGQ